MCLVSGIVKCTEDVSISSPSEHDIRQSSGIVGAFWIGAEIETEVETGEVDIDRKKHFYCIKEARTQ